MEFFAAGPAPAPAPRSSQKPWCVLLVDDDVEVHDVTRLALRKFEFQHRGLELISAYSAREAQQVFHERSDIALAVIDVVMETEHAGLELVRWLRDKRLSPLTRLVLRTGQAGLAPEEQVIRQFDIDAYKEKTELTTLKLRSVLYTSLRNFRSLADKEAEVSAQLSFMDALPKLRASDTSAATDTALAILQMRFPLAAEDLMLTPSPADTSDASQPLRVRDAARSGMDERLQAQLTTWLAALNAAWPDARSAS